MYCANYENFCQNIVLCGQCLRIFLEFSSSEKLKQNRHSLIKSRLTDLNSFIHSSFNWFPEYFSVWLRHQWRWRWRFSKGGQISNNASAIYAIQKPPSDWKRPKGRPSHTWLRAIEADLKPLNIGLSSACREEGNQSGDLHGDQWWTQQRSRRVCHEKNNSVEHKLLCEITALMDRADILSVCPSVRPSVCLM